MSVLHLRKIASQLGIPGRSKMRKNELEAAIKRYSKSSRSSRAPFKIPQYRAPSKIPQYRAPVVDRKARILELEKALCAIKLDESGDIWACGKPVRETDYKTVMARFPDLTISDLIQYKRTSPKKGKISQTKLRSMREEVKKFRQRREILAKKFNDLGVEKQMKIKDLYQALCQIPLDESGHSWACGKPVRDVDFNAVMSRFPGVTIDDLRLYDEVGKYMMR